MSQRKTRIRYRTRYEPAPAAPRSENTIDIGGLWFKLSPLVAIIALVVGIYTRFDNPQREIETKYLLLEQKVETISLAAEAERSQIRAALDANTSKDDDLRVEVADLNRKIDQILYALEYDTKPSNASISLPNPSTDPN